MGSSDALSSSSSPSSPLLGGGGGGDGGRTDKKKEALGWIEWARGWCGVVGEFIFQRIAASHVENPLPLPPLDGVTCIVTGATSGIGLEIARQLAEAGAHLVMAVRRTKVAQELIQKWQNEKAESGLLLNAEVMELDLVSLDSVARFAEAWNARGAPLHVLINNAGIFTIGEPQHFTEDGYEEHMQVNHLAPALLSLLLFPSLIRGSPSRIINVNSVVSGLPMLHELVRKGLMLLNETELYEFPLAEMHSVSFVDAEDMNMTTGRRKYSSLYGYSNSKLAQVKFCSILHKRIPAEAGIDVLCVSPGIVHTNVARDLPKYIIAAYRLIPYFIFTPMEGSRSTLFAATDPQVPEYCALLKADEWPVCPYISYDCRPTNASEEAHNLETSQEVWEKTLELIGLPLDALDKLLQGEPVQCRYGPKNSE